MKKVGIISLVIILVAVIGYFIFLNQFTMFEDDYTEIDSFDVNNRSFIIYHYKGNATTNETIQLREVINETDYNLKVFENYKAVVDKKIKNDSIIELVLENSLNKKSDTIRVNLNQKQ